jgi:hypothetical protein
MQRLLVPCILPSELVSSALPLERVLSEPLSAHLLVSLELVLS